MSDTDKPGGLDAGARRELRQIAARLRHLTGRSRPLELVCHDLARIMERLADAGSTAEIEATTVYCVITEPERTHLWRLRPEGSGVAPPGLAEEKGDEEAGDRDNR